MKKRMIKHLSLLLASVMLVGCGQQTANSVESSSTNTSEVASSSTVESTQPSSEVESVEPSVALEDVDFSGVEFRIAWWGGDARHNATLELLKDFGSKYKNLTVKEQYSGFNDYFTQIETQLTGNIEPDVYQMDWSKILSFVESDQLLDLTPYIESGALDLSNVDPSTIAIGEMNGGNYAIATGINAPLYLYNPAIAEEAGVDVTRAIVWDDLVDICKKVYDKTGARAQFDFEGFIRACGETYFTEDGKAVGFSPETLAAWWEFQTEGMEYGFIASPENMPDDTVTAISEGDYWIAYRFTNQLEIMEKDAATDMEWFAYPISDKNTATSFLKPNTLWAIKADTENPDLAVAFLNYWVNDTKVYEICGIDRGFPISSEVAEYLEPNFSDSNKEVVEILNYLAEEKLLSPIEPPAPSKSGEAKDELSLYAEQVDYGMIDTKDFLNTAEEAISKMNKVLQSE